MNKLIWLSLTLIMLAMAIFCGYGVHIYSAKHDLVAEIIFIIFLGVFSAATSECFLGFMGEFK